MPGLPLRRSEATVFKPLKPVPGRNKTRRLLVSPNPAQSDETERPRKDAGDARLTVNRAAWDCSSYLQSQSTKRESGPALLPAPLSPPRRVAGSLRARRRRYPFRNAPGRCDACRTPPCCRNGCYRIVMLVASGQDTAGGEARRILGIGPVQFPRTLAA